MINKIVIFVAVDKLVNSRWLYLISDTKYGLWYIVHDLVVRSTSVTGFQYYS